MYRSMIGRHPAARRAYSAMVRGRARVVSKLLDRVPFERLPAPVALHLAYQVVLERAPDPVGEATYLPRLARGTMSKRELVETLRGSAEFESRPAFSAAMLGPSIHAGRCRFIRALPAARRIVDLGGTSLGDRRGALVLLGYPYRFESLVIVDLPPDDRHSLYYGDRYDEVDTERGPVSYRYHSMVDLSAFTDQSVDLVYSGQSLEHVTPDEGAVVAKEAWRILRPGGYLAVDTPNGRVTRIQQDEFIDPDHKVEYTWVELRDLLIGAGFEIEWRAGLNYAGRSVEAGRFDSAEASGNVGFFHAIEDCYILAVVARKPSS
ncbi:MAG: methyltransferase domain-containing protein [Acidimicrobiales bacterium]|nr:methyltransferase domain-containing protein [Acidimicrobiales bacterium]